MNWIEVIRIRAPTDLESGILESLEHMLREVRGEPDRPERVKAYLPAVPTGDITIVIHWCSTDGGTASRLALSLLSDLQNVGLARHSVWIELPDQPTAAQSRP